MTQCHAPKDINLQSICKTRALLKTGIHFSSHIFTVRL